jgi:hypothetical protein
MKPWTHSGESALVIVLGKSRFFVVNAQIPLELNLPARLSALYTLDGAALAIRSIARLWPGAPLVAPLLLPFFGLG